MYRFKREPSPTKLCKLCTRPCLLAFAPNPVTLSCTSESCGTRCWSGGELLASLSAAVVATSAVHTADAAARFASSATLPHYNGTLPFIQICAHFARLHASWAGLHPPTVDVDTSSRRTRASLERLRTRDVSAQGNGLYLTYFAGALVVVRPALPSSHRNVLRTAVELWASASPSACASAPRHTSYRHMKRFAAGQAVCW